MNKGIKSCIISSAIILLTVALVFYIFPIANTDWFSFHVHAQGAGPVEIACPSISSPISSGQTLNLTTQKYRQVICVDINGNLILNGGPTSSAPAPIQIWGGQNITSVGQGITFCTYPATINGNCVQLGSIGLGVGSVWQFTGSPFVSGAISSARYVASGAAPTCTVSVGAGTGATCSMSGNSTDNSGQMQINTGTAPGSAGTITLTYNSAFPNVACPVGMLVNASSSWNARATIIGTSTCSNNTYVFNWDNNAVTLTASQADSLAVNYAVIGK